MSRFRFLLGCYTVSSLGRFPRSSMSVRGSSLVRSFLSHLTSCMPLNGFLVDISSPFPFFSYPPCPASIHRALARIHGKQLDYYPATLARPFCFLDVATSDMVRAWLQGRNTGHTLPLAHRQTMISCLCTWRASPISLEMRSFGMM